MEVIFFASPHSYILGRSVTAARGNRICLVEKRKDYYQVFLAKQTETFPTYLLIPVILALLLKTKQLKQLKWGKILSYFLVDSHITIIVSSFKVTILVEICPVSLVLIIRVIVVVVCGGGRTSVSIVHITLVCLLFKI